MKSKLLKLHNRILDLSQVNVIFIADSMLIFGFNSGLELELNFPTEKDAILIFDKCYEIMKC